MVIKVCLKQYLNTTIAVSTPPTTTTIIRVVIAKVILTEIRWKVTISLFRFLNKIVLCIYNNNNNNNKAIKIMTMINLNNCVVYTKINNNFMNNVNNLSIRIWKLPIRTDLSITKIIRNVRHHTMIMLI